MNFLGVFFLLALPLVGIPIVIHFLRRRRRGVTPWGAMQFLRVSHQRSQRFSNLDRWLLMALRMLAIACLIGALAQPAFRFGSSSSGNALTPQVLILDDTRSTLTTDHRSGQTMFEQIRTAALQWLDELPTGTPVEVWTVGTPVQRIGIATTAGSPDWRAIKTQIQSYVPRGGGTDFTTNIRRIGSSAMAERESSDRSESVAEQSSLHLNVPRLDLWLMTDGRQAGWDKNVSPVRIAGEQRNHLHLITLGDHPRQAQRTYQLGVESLIADRDRVSVGQTTRIVANIANHGAVASPEVTGVWKRDDVVLATSTIASLQPGSQTIAQTEVEMASPGTSAITFQLTDGGEKVGLPGDPLPADDAGGTVIDAIGRQPLLIVEGQSQWIDGAPTEADYIAAALGENLGVWKTRQTGQSLYHPVLKHTKELEEVQWYDYPVIVLLADAVLPKSAEDQLIAAVRSGCGLWITLGPESDLAYRNELLSRLGIQNQSESAGLIGPLVVHTDAESMDRIHPPDENDDVLAALADTERLDLDEVRIHRRFDLSVGNSDRTRSLLRTFGGNSLAMLTNFGRGRVVVQAFPLDPNWSNFALSNSFVVWIAELTDHLADPRAEQHHLAIGRMIRARVEQAGEAYGIRLPSGTVEDVLALPSARSNDLDGGVIRFQQTQRPGLYTLFHRESPEDPTAGVAPIHYWVNADAEESKVFDFANQWFRKFSQHARIDWTNVGKSFKPQTILRQIEPQDVDDLQHPVWPWLLLGMVIAILLETFMAGYAALRRYGRFSRPNDHSSSDGIAGSQDADSPSLNSDVPWDQPHVFTGKIVSGSVVILIGLLAASPRSVAEETTTQASVGGDELTITEGMTTQGWLGVDSALIIGTLVLVVTAIWLYRQRDLLGRGTTGLIALLRTAAIVAAIWMLIEPSWTKTETWARHAEILVMADASRSMETVDSPESSSATRWSRAINGATDDLLHLESAFFHLRLAVQHQEQSGRLSPNSLAQAIDSLTRISSAKSTAVQSVLTAIRGAQTAAEESLHTADKVEQQALLASQAEAMETAIVELQSLVEIEGEMLRHVTPTIERSRKEYISMLLDQLEGEWSDVNKGEANQQSVRVRRAVFNHQVTPVDDTEGQTWQNRLALGTQRQADQDTAVADEERRGQRTDLSEALAFAGSLATNRPLAAVVLLSEGQHNAASTISPVEAAAGLPDVPVFTVPIGDTTRQRDVAIYRVNAPAIVYLDDSPLIEVILSAHQCAGDWVDVTLKLGEEIIQTQTAQFESDQSDLAIRFDVPHRGVGRHEYSIEVSSVDGESNTQNNHGFVAIETIKSKMYVLIADGRPRWESRYLEQLFRRDKRISLDKVLLKPTIKTTVGDSRMPLPDDPDLWAKFDVVILGDLPPHVLTPSVRRAITTYVERGGRLVVVAGKDYMPAAYIRDDWFDLLPVSRTPAPVSLDHRPQPTIEGMLTRMFRLEDTLEGSEQVWERAMRGPFPGFLSPYHTAKPSANVLARLGFPGETGDVPDPLLDNANQVAAWLSIHRFGRGRVAYLSSPITYRLRIRSGDPFHHQFWGQMVRYLSSSDLAAGDGQVRIQTDRSQYDEGSKPRVRVRLRSPDGQPLRGAPLKLLYTATREEDAVAVEMSEEKQVPGTYVFTLPALPVGVYRAWVQGAMIQEPNQESSFAKFTIQPTVGLESLLTQANPLLLRQIAETSGGLPIDPALIREIPKAISLRPEVTQVRQTRPLWNRWSSLWLIVGCLSVEWFLRRRRGLV